eukprot:CAMPEP_0179289856 /NCGR_PEP_ID=MMETSP0797-20121207/41518_1 /TAXON_ID=47934 /ORGANISM="Dinophysis acuminata, Strain DAEP01" /LENGTH=129 /DNA_ID=CAMNT_0020998875 /DNA_START=42 /DNA_END=428 /DNA_ORIENTATION=-
MEDGAADDGKVRFTITVGDGEPKVFERRCGETISIGRGPKSDFVLSHLGTSANHLILKPMPLKVGGQQSIAVHDISQNGVGFRTTPTGPLKRLVKNVDTVILDNCFFLLMPFKVKVKDGADPDLQRVCL